MKFKKNYGGESGFGVDSTGVAHRDSVAVIGQYPVRLQSPDVKLHPPFTSRPDLTSSTSSDETPQSSPFRGCELPKAASHFSDMASSSSALCARRASLATKSNYTPFTPPAFTASVCRGATQTKSRYRAYATVNKPPKVLYDVWGQIPEPPPGMFARWFDATRQAQERDKGAKWLRYSDEEYLNAVEMFRQAAPKFGSDWVLKLKKGVSCYLLASVDHVWLTFS